MIDYSAIPAIATAFRAQIDAIEARPGLTQAYRVEEMQRATLVFLERLENAALPIFGYLLAVGENKMQYAVDLTGTMWQQLDSAQKSVETARRAAERAGLDPAWIGYAHQQAEAAFSRALAMENPLAKQMAVDLLEKAYSTGTPEYRHCAQDAWPDRLSRHPDNMGFVALALRLRADRRAKTEDDPTVKLALEMQRALFADAAEALRAAKNALAIMARPVMYTVQADVPTSDMAGWYGSRQRVDRQIEASLLPEGPVILALAVKGVRINVVTGDEPESGISGAAISIDRQPVSPHMFGGTGGALGPKYQTFVPRSDPAYNRIMAATITSGDILTAMRGQ